MGCGSSYNKKKPRKLLKEFKSMYLDRILLMWVRARFSLYHRLSLNVVREIAQFITTRTRDQSLILACAGSQAYLFSPTSKKISLYFRVTLENAQNIQKCIFMGEEKVLLSLQSTGENIFAIYTKGQVQSLGERASKKGCEMIYNQFQACVYIFGGGDFRSYSTAASEAFTDSPPHFRRMNDMLHGRSGFGCCWHAQLIYLWGGWFSTQETFDPRSETFADYAVMDDVQNIVFAASYKGEMVCLSLNTIWILKVGYWERRNRKPMYNPHSGTAYVWDGVIYYQHSDWKGDSIVGLDLFKGKQSYYMLRDHKV